jgi:hypothetical protein
MEAMKRKPSLSVLASFFKISFIGLILSPLLYAKGVDIESIIKGECGSSVKIIKKSMLLTHKQAKAIEAKAHMKLHSKIIRLYLANKEEQTYCYGIVLSRKVRTKKAAVLYMIDPKGIIKAIEILAFTEPPEFQPKEKWISNLKGKKLDDPLRVGRDVPTISGATLSARNITEGARLALAIFDVAIKGK